MNRRSVHFIFFNFFWIIGVLLTPAYAVIDIQVTGDTEHPIKIAFMPFVNTANNQIDPRWEEIIQADLESTGYFSFVRGIQPAGGMELDKIDFSALGAQGLEYFVSGRLQQNPKKLAVRFRLLDIYRKEALLHTEFSAQAIHYRQLAHSISDAIFTTLVGERGDFSSKIVFVREYLDQHGKRVYALTIADPDGKNTQDILNSKWPIMSPNWSPTGDKIVYVSFEKGRSEIYEQNIHNGKRKLLSRLAGLNSSPAWSPDGGRLAFTTSQDGNSEIYVLDLGSGHTTRLTNNAAIDTEPSWSPDGKRLVFTSDRTGSPQVYELMVQNPQQIKRLTFSGRYNAGPVYAPDGAHIALLHQVDRAYRIALLGITNGEMRVLTDSSLDESPTFSPSGNLILFCTQQNGYSKLATVSLKGNVVRYISPNHRQIIRDASWGPSL